MILPGATLFPGALLPLHIFEPRYRKMLGKALVKSRMFAVAHSEDDGGISAVAGLGVVRACVANADGTSNLILQGAARVVISELKMAPFPQATISLLADEEADDDKAKSLRLDLEKAFLQVRTIGVEIPQGFEGYLAQIACPGAYADAIASAIIQDPVERRGLLEEIHVPTRLSRLLRCLMRQLQEP
ncbi:MAG: LON peptidase substrate-binding domain-containing protein [Terrimicrobiaceae bacterium]